MMIVTRVDGGRNGSGGFDLRLNLIRNHGNSAPNLGHGECRRLIPSVFLLSGGPINFIGAAILDPRLPAVPNESALENKIPPGYPVSGMWHGDINARTPVAVNPGDPVSVVMKEEEPSGGPKMGIGHFSSAADDLDTIRIRERLGGRRHPQVWSGRYDSPVIVDKKVLDKKGERQCLLLIWLDWKFLNTPSFNSWCPVPRT